VIGTGCVGLPLMVLLLAIRRRCDEHGRRVRSRTGRPSGRVRLPALSGAWACQR
jgi:hypothetical protein